MTREKKNREEKGGEKKGGNERKKETIPNPIIEPIAGADLGFEKGGGGGGGKDACAEHFTFNAKHVAIDKRSNHLSQKTKRSSLLR